MTLKDTAAQWALWGVPGKQGKTHGVRTLVPATGDPSQLPSFQGGNLRV